QFVAGIKNNVHMIDLDKSAKEMDRAFSYMAGLVGEGKTILFIGTKIQVKDLVKRAAESCNMPYVTERWLGGTITNFETISKRISYYKELESKKATGGLEKYTKKERAMFDKELAGLKKNLEGIKLMSKLPDAVLILDIKK